MKKPVNMPVRQSCPKSAMMMKLTGGLLYALTGVLLFMGILTLEWAFALFLVVKGLKKMLYSCC